MASLANKRSIMTLYSGSDPKSQQVRLVLEEKKITCEVLDRQSSPRVQQELVECNPYHSVPTLVDRDLVLYPALNIMEYLDERFPHPPLMPVYPVARGRTRLMMYRVDRDWYQPMERILANASPAIVEAARQELRDSLVSVTPVLSDMPYFLSEDFSLVDCCIAPLLWRLPKLGITLPPEAKPVIDYAERLFQRESFQASLTPAEKAMRS
jgi:RNA polymerase-associated protein